MTRTAEVCVCVFTKSEVNTSEEEVKLKKKRCVGSRGRFF